jgi:hypothetical protein
MATFSTGFPDEDNRDPKLCVSVETTPAPIPVTPPAPTQVPVVPGPLAPTGSKAPVQAPAQPPVGAPYAAIYVSTAPEMKSPSTVYVPPPSSVPTGACQRIVKTSLVKLRWDFALDKLGTEILKVTEVPILLDSTLKQAAIKAMLRTNTGSIPMTYIIPERVALMATENDSDFPFVVNSQWIKRPNYFTTDGQEGTFGIAPNSVFQMENGQVLFCISEAHKCFIETKMCAAVVGKSMQELLTEKMPGDFMAQFPLPGSPATCVAHQSMLGKAIEHLNPNVFLLKHYKPDLQKEAGIDVLLIDNTQFEAVLHKLEEHLEFIKDVTVNVADIHNVLSFELANPPINKDEVIPIGLVVKQVVEAWSNKGEGAEYIMHKNFKVGALLEVTYSVIIHK